MRSKIQEKADWTLSYTRGRANSTTEPVNRLAGTIESSSKVLGLHQHKDCVVDIGLL